MALNEDARREGHSEEESEEGSEEDEEDSEEESEEDEEEGSSEDSYDYGFAGSEDQEGEEDGSWEVDYASMNVSPDILRMLGASEEVVAAKKAQLSSVASTWVAPTKTGLEHSAAIADSSAVAIGGGREPDGSGVQRFFEAVGCYDKDVEELATINNAPIMKVKIAHSPEVVSQRRESKLPPRRQDRSDSDGSDAAEDDDESEDSWDELSAADGYDWWESGPKDEERVMAAMSPNLQAILGLTKPPEGLTNKLGSGEEGSDINDWRPPPFAGLSNSKPVTTLSTLVVGQEKGLEVERRNRKEAEGESGSDGEEDEEWLEEEGWDYEGVPDDGYLLEWTTNISPNLAKVMGCSSTVKQKAEALSTDFSWKPPASSGLTNSMPIVDFDPRRGATRAANVINNSWATTVKNSVALNWDALQIQNGTPNNIVTTRISPRLLE